ncbi:nucleotide disphospho-sugar-binding domain-containing protein [Streptomyces lushanensis]|uniref:nucleotide disphospho-sugar-binding domain-containing protein n=1 Tax=Streptomyces lushanensis TaxID=1434255 RepID=UPI00082D0B50|nr:nucleotide disphospho-sugar-binding domain-containing protein [Streptomyces lushanensis]
MRVMIVVWPLPAHLYPALPLAWALQGAGHEVRVASHPDLAGVITASGFDAVALGTPQTMPSPSAVGDLLLSEEHRGRLADALSLSPDDHVWATFSTYTYASSRIFHPEDGAPEELWAGVDALVSTARHWRPDLMLWDPNWPSGAVAARDIGAAHARMLWGHDFVGWAAHRTARGREALRSAGLADPVAELVRPSAERYGVTVDDELLFGQFTVDPMLPDMQLRAPCRRVPVRRIPYGGPDVVPDWLHTPPERPRLAMSLGTTQRAYDNDRGLVADLLEVVSGLDVDVVATVDASQLAGSALPDNVRTVSYLPLGLLLPTCSALVHHGGIGTLMTAVAHGVPQFVVADATAAYAGNARYVHDYGAGLTVGPRTPATEMRKDLERVLTEPAFQDAAEQLRRDWLAVPSPDDLVPVLEGLVSSLRQGRRP